MKLRNVIAVSLLIVFSCLVQKSYALSYEIVDLGTLGGGSYSQANAINDAGVVVGQYTNASDNNLAFIYQNGQMTSLGTLGGNSTAFDINENNYVVGTTYPSDVRTAFLWTSGGGMQSLGQGVAVGINESNVVALGYYGNAAYTWSSSTGRVNIGNPSGSAYVYTRDINDSGKVVGTARSSNYSLYYAFYYDGTMHTLPNLGINVGRVSEINNSNIMAGYSTTAGGYTEACIWENATSIISIGTLGGNESWAEAINDENIIVGSSLTSSDDEHAFVYMDDQMLDLNDYIDASSGWVLTTAQDINLCGQIVGAGIINGETHAFLLNLIEDSLPEPVAVPEPASIILVTLSLLGISKGIRKQ